ncbi:MAG: VOC family protein [Celeribacter sp.]|jgi:catechol 2,3-dioxygenase-like lactoylglutathione lyase family enzyme
MIMSKHGAALRGAAISDVDHVALTVPDHDAAVAFCMKALGAEVLYTRSQGQSVAGAEEAVDCAIRAVSRLRIGRALVLELYELSGIHREIAADFGDWEVSRFCVTTEDRDAAIARFRAGGGRMIDTGFAPRGQVIRTRVQDAHQGRYGRCPWGSVIEFVERPAACAGTTRPVERDLRGA